MNAVFEFLDLYQSRYAGALRGERQEKMMKNIEKLLRYGETGAEEIPEAKFTKTLVGLNEMLKEANRVGKNSGKVDGLNAVDDFFFGKSEKLPGAATGK